MVGTFCNLSPGALAFTPMLQQQQQLLQQQQQLLLLRCSCLMFKLHVTEGESKDEEKRVVGLASTF